MNSFSLGKKKKKANATVLVKTENVSINNLEHIKVNKNSKKCCELKHVFNKLE